MPKQTIESLVEGGKATAAPPLGPALGPLGVNIGQVVAEINKKTTEFKGMKVPVKVTVDSETKEFEISVGTPPTSALVKQEAKITKGSGNPLQDKVADLRIEQIIKIAKMKESALLGKTRKEKVLEIIGTCQSMGVMVQGVPAHDAVNLVKEGKFDKEIESGKTELSAEELKDQADEKIKLEQDMKERREEFISTANGIIKSMEGKERGPIKAKLVEAEIPMPIINELLPEEEEKKPAAEGGEEKKEEAPKEEKKK